MSRDDSIGMFAVPTRLSSPARRFAADVIGYGLSSAAALILDFGILILLTRLFHFNYLIAAAVGFLSGLGLVYALCVGLIFRKRRRLSSSRELAGFLATGCAGLLINQVLLYLLVDVGELQVEAAKVLTAGVVFMFNFLSRRLLIFKAAAGS